MKKTLVCLALAIVFVFGGCETDTETGDNKSNAAAVNKAVDAINNENCVSGKYMLEVTFGEGTTLYYAIGDVEWDRKEKTAHAVFDQTYLAMSSRMENYFSNGKMISVSGGNAVATERDAKELFAKFPYSKVYAYGKNCGEISVGSNSTGTTYSFSVTNAKELSQTIIGEDIYKIVNVINKPQPEKTQYGDIKCVYTVKNGKILSARYEYTIKLFDTPAYIPGYSVPESDYTLNVQVVAKISYNSVGESIEIDEFSGEISEEASESETSKNSEEASE